MRLALLREPLPGWRMALAHRAGSALDHTKWSHGELVFSDHATGSAWARGGVQIKRLPPEHYNADIWDYFALPDALEPAARAWFEANAGRPYDYLGPARFALGIISQSVDRYYCHEAIAESLGLRDAWRYTGGLFAATGPAIWPGIWRPVPAPWPTVLPTRLEVCRA